MTIRRLLLPAAILLLTSGARAAPVPPETGAANNEWSVTFVDAALTTSWAILGEGGSVINQLAADSTFSVAFSAQSLFDSLRTGNDGVGTLTGVYTMASTADQSTRNNFFQNKASTGTVSFISAPFTSAASPRNASNAWGYLIRGSDTDYRLGATWAIGVFAKGTSPGNPGVGQLQTAVSLASTPMRLSIGFNPAGKVYGMVKDSAGVGIGVTGWDSITSTSDVYDGAYHAITFSCASSVLSLQVDGDTARTKALSHAKSTLTPLDTLRVLAQRATQFFRGQVDELYITESAGPLTADTKAYLWRALRNAVGTYKDTAGVWIQGLKASDSVMTQEYLKVAVSSANTSSNRYKLFQTAWMDSDETSALHVFSSVGSPRAAGSLLDSIPANMIHAPNGIMTFGRKDDNPYWLGAEASKGGTADSVYLELRCYPDWKDARAPTTGYYVLWQGVLADAESFIRTDREVLLPRPGYLAMFGRANAAAGSAVRVSFWGRRGK